MPVAALCRRAIALLQSALKAPVLNELVSEDVYVFGSSGGRVLEARDDLGDGLVGRSHTFGEGTADLVDELAGCRGVGVEHLEEPVPTNAVRLDHRHRLDTRGGPGSVRRPISPTTVGASIVARRCRRPGSTLL